MATVTVAIWSAVSNAGPFTGLSHIDTVISLQGLILVVAISTFMLAFSIEDLRRTERDLVREVEQRKTAEDEVRQINHRLEQSNRSLDQVIANRTDELRKSLMRNEILLKELKHRVKNNLQIVSGLIGLQSRSLSDQNTKDQLVRLQAQIGAIAATYELLHRTQGQETVDLGKLIPALCHNLEGSHGESISISVSVIGCAPVSADTSVALSLVLNELITNSIKHATGRVSIAVTCIRNCEKIELRVADNGPGFPPGFDINEAQSFGLRVAGALIMQANGEWRLSSNEGGATIEIVVPAAREPDRETGL